MELPIMIAALLLLTVIYAFLQLSNRNKKIKSLEVKNESLSTSLRQRTKTLAELQASNANFFKDNQACIEENQLLILQLKEIHDKAVKLHHKSKEEIEHKESRFKDLKDEKGELNIDGMMKIEAIENEETRKSLWADWMSYGKFLEGKKVGKEFAKLSTYNAN